MKIKHNYDLNKRSILIKKFLCKFRIMILIENPNLKPAKCWLTKICKG